MRLVYRAHLGAAHAEGEGGGAGCGPLVGGRGAVGVAITAGDRVRGGERLAIGHQA